MTEDGVKMEPPDFLRHAARELSAVLPGWTTGEVEWSCYRVNRAERATSEGMMPGDVQIIQDGNRWTVWPTKLVMAPLLSERVIQLLELPDRSGDDAWRASCADLRWPAAEVALPPWEWDLTWNRDV